MAVLEFPGLDSSGTKRKGINAETHLAFSDFFGISHCNLSGSRLALGPAAKRAAATAQTGASVSFSGVEPWFAPKQLPQMGQELEKFGVIWPDF